MLVRDVNVLIDRDNQSPPNVRTHARRVSVGPRGAYAVTVLTTETNGSAADAKLRIYVGDGSHWSIVQLTSSGDIGAKGLVKETGTTNHAFLLVVLEVLTAGKMVVCDLSINTA